MTYRCPATQLPISIIHEFLPNFMRPYFGNLTLNICLSLKTRLEINNWFPIYTRRHNTEAVAASQVDLCGNIIRKSFAKLFEYLMSLIESPNIVGPHTSRELRTKLFCFSEACSFESINSKISTPFCFPFTRTVSRGRKRNSDPLLPEFHC